jgi:glycine/D-amino acid oxidase-like deaminating enzyme
MSILILGGGITGLSAALHARRIDPTVPVTVLERQQVGAAASGASAAGVRVMGRHPAERALALDSLARWPELARDLEGRTHYRRGGGLRVALDEAAWAALPAWVADQRGDGVPLEIVEGGAMRRLTPGLSDQCLGGVHCPIDGQAEALPTVRAFAAAARSLGARIEEGVGVRRVIVEGDRAVGVERADGGRVAADVLVVAAGAWSGALLAPHGVLLPLETRALQMLLTVPAARSLGQVLGAFDRRLSLKQLADGSYLIGGGWPARIVDESDNRWHVLDASIRASREIAAAVYPALRECALARTWAGLEAFTPDEIPLLGAVPGVRGLVVAAGFCGHGFALAPAVGDIVARVALGRDAREDTWRGLRLDRIFAPSRDDLVRSCPHIAQETTP